MDTLDCCCKRGFAGDWHVYLHVDAESNYRRGGDVRRVLMLWVLDWVSQFETSTWAQVLSYMSVITHFDSFAKGVLDTKDVILM